MLELFQITGSCSFAARAALEETGVEYAVVDVHPRRRDEIPAFGVLNPLRAITGMIPAAGAKPGVAPSAAAGVADTARVDGVPVALAGGVAIGLLVLAGVLIAIGILSPLGRRRRWRPGRLAAPAPSAQENRP